MPNSPGNIWTTVCNKARKGAGPDGFALFSWHQNRENDLTAVWVDIIIIKKMNQ